MVKILISKERKNYVIEINTRQFSDENTVYSYTTRKEMEKNLPIIVAAANKRYDKKVKVFYPLDFFALK